MLRAYHVQMHFSTDVHSVQGCPCTWQLMECDVKLQSIVIKVKQRYMQGGQHACSSHLKYIMWLNPMVHSTFHQQHTRLTLISSISPREESTDSSLMVFMRNHRPAATAALEVTVGLTAFWEVRQRMPDALRISICQPEQLLTKLREEQA